MKLLLSKRLAQVINVHVWESADMLLNPYFLQICKVPNGQLMQKIKGSMPIVDKHDKIMVKHHKLFILLTYQAEIIRISNQSN